MPEVELVWTLGRMNRLFIFSRIEVFGDVWIDRWLREQYDCYPMLTRLVTSPSWREIDGGRLVNRLCYWLGGYLPAEEKRKHGRDLPFYCRCQQLLFNNLLMALPVDQLNDSQLECRMSLDIGL
jgi:hypothetical protein